jgi:cytochrome c biogenesis protein CcmG, thiol:disulfide interchange protein DsbE
MTAELTSNAEGTDGASGVRPGVRQRIRESRFGTFIVLGVTAVIVAAAATMIDRPGSEEVAGGAVTAIELTGEGRGDPPVIGQPAQDFVALTVDGTEVSLSDFRGHPVWLTFGASWCAACKAEAFDIQNAYAAHEKDGAVVLGVFISEDDATVRDYAGRVGLTYPAIADPNTDIASAYRVLGVPAHFFIDADGIIRSISTGTLTPQQMDESITGLT